MCAHFRSQPAALPHCCPGPGWTHPLRSLPGAPGRDQSRPDAGWVPRVQKIPGSSGMWSRGGGWGKQQGTQPLGLTPHSGERHRARAPPPAVVQGQCDHWAHQCSPGGTPCSSRLWFILAMRSVHSQKCILVRTSESIHTIISTGGHISNHRINSELAQMQAVGEGKRKQAE